MPTSNLIGRIRFIPVHRSKAILVLAPVEYQQSIRDMIEELDQPGKQVMIKVAIIDINHEKLLDLGAKLSSNPSALGTVGTNALLALTQLNYTQNQGIFTVDKTEFQKGATTSININTLVDFLAQEADARVLIEPTLWTKDNEEADFFRGGLIPFIVSSTLSQETTATKDSVEYRPVGVTLRVRPNITPEKAVDLTINLIISQLAPTLVNGNIATDELNTTTHMIVEDGETIMLGGILDTTDSKTVEKIPFLGDLPFIGGLFRNTSTELSNNELIVFITPYVMDDQSTPEAINQLKDATDKLDDLKQHFKEALEQEEKKKNKKS
jgi:general secretion pathway protein D